MAALTSNQSGNFTASATWGGSTPADGDTFTIAAGHSVTSSTVNMPTNGYGDITIHGCWSMQSGSQFKLNGRATVYGGENHFFTEGESDSAGKLEMQPNTELVLKGSNSEQHGLWLETEKHAQMICDGGEKNLNTVISCSGFLDYKQDYLPVISASNFAAGDWISVFSRFEGYQPMSDEGFIVHDTDTTAGLNKIYYRQFVSPSATIESVVGRRLVVDNAKVFRTGYKIIFGTGDNRNVVTIVGLDFVRNFVIVDADITGTVVGETIYQTGNEKKHVNGHEKDLLTESGSIVRRNATTLTTAIETASGSSGDTNQIVVGNTSDLVVGDSIIIDVNNDTDTNWDYDTRYTITAIDGTTLTLDDQVRFVHKVGSLVHNMNRDCIIKAEDPEDRVFIYCEEWATTTSTSTLKTTMFLRRIRFRNVLFDGLGGNTGNNYYRGVTIAGYNGGLDPTNTSESGSYGFQTELDGCVYDGHKLVTSGSYSQGSSYQGVTIRRSYYMTTRNNTIYNTERGLNVWSSHYHHGIFNNYSTRVSYANLLESQYQTYNAFSYNYYTRTDDYGIITYHLRSPAEIRHNVFLNHEQRPFYNYYAAPQVMYDRFFIDGHRGWPFTGEAGGPHLFHDSVIKNRWYGGTSKASFDGSGQVYSNYFSAQQSYQTDYDRNRGKGGQQIWQEYQHEIDGLAVFHHSTLREFLNDEGCWLSHNGSDQPAGYVDIVYVPPQTTVRISCEVNCQSSGTFSFPYLFARTAHDMQLTGRRDDGAADETNMTSTTAKDIGRSKGFIEEVQYTSDSQSDFENKTLTIQPQKDGYYLNFGVSVKSTNIREEPYKMKEPIVRFDQRGIGQSRVDTNVNTNPVLRNSFTTFRKRISGRI